MTKTCVECRYMLHKDTFEVCTHSMTNTSMFNEACKYFEPKVITNGDKIIAGGMRAIAELGFGNKCARCIYSTYEEDVGFGEAGWTCNHPKDKDCVDGIEAWLNAPAESEGESEN